MSQSDEVERLSRKLVAAYKEIGILKQATSEQAAYNSRVITDGRQRIAELEAEAQAFHDLKEELASHLKTAKDRIGELEGWLVEERIAGEFSDWIENQCPYWDIDDDPFCAKLDGPCEYREGKCPITNELRGRARQQLTSEGKIMPDDKSAPPVEMFAGQLREVVCEHCCEKCREKFVSSDHIVEPDKMVLTEEQRDALELARDHLHQTNCPECEILMIRCDPSPAIDIISQMLSGSIRAWGVTEERYEAIASALCECERLALDHEEMWADDVKVLRAMLEEDRP